MKKFRKSKGKSGAIIFSLNINPFFLDVTV